jgi:hypothetical protein
MCFDDIIFFVPVYIDLQFIDAIIDVEKKTELNELNL